MPAEPSPEVLGVCGHRGWSCPSSALARLLGRSENGDAPRWMLLAGGADASPWPSARSTGTSSSAVGPEAGAGEAVGHLAEIVEIGGAGRPVVSIPSLLRAITGH